MPPRRRRGNSKYSALLDSSIEANFLDSSDQFFKSLGLCLCFIPIKPTDNSSKHVKECLVKSLWANDSMMRNSDLCDVEPFRSICSDTLLRETVLLRRLQSSGFKMAHPSDGDAELTEAEIQESLVVLDEKSHSFLLMAVFADCADTALKPIIGAVISMTAGIGEVELRWAFSKASEYAQDLGIEKYKVVQNELEEHFLYRVLTEAFLLEVLRVTVLTKEGLRPPPERNVRFVSVVTLDLVYFPRSMIQALCCMEKFQRHYSTMNSKGASHTTACRCRQRLSQMCQPRKSLRPPVKPPNSVASDYVLSERQPTVDMWSFYSITLNCFDRVLLQRYERLSFLDEASPQLKEALMCIKERIASTTMSSSSFH